MKVLTLPWQVTLLVQTILRCRNPVYRGSSVVAIPCSGVRGRGASNVSGKGYGALRSGFQPVLCLSTRWDLLPRKLTFGVRPPFPGKQHDSTAFSFPECSIGRWASQHSAIAQGSAPRKQVDTYTIHRTQPRYRTGVGLADGNATRRHCIPTPGLNLVIALCVVFSSQS